MLDLQKLGEMADRLTPEEMPTLMKLVSARYGRQLKLGVKLKPQQVLPCPKCGRKRTIKIRHGDKLEFAKVCGNPECNFTGYISSTDSKRGGHIVSCWNRAVKDYLDKTYTEPAIDETWQVV